MSKRRNDIKAKTKSQRRAMEAKAFKDAKMARKAGRVPALTIGAPAPKAGASSKEIR